MPQNAKGFAEFQAKKALKDRQHWEKWRRRGFAAYIASSITIWVGAVAVIYLIHFLLFLLGWFHLPNTESLLDLFIFAVVSGILAGTSEWFRIKRKFDTALPAKN
jgi:uncharacterized membrane protein YbhN (UPF0104 family)